jgi:hypothetical protein
LANRSKAIIALKGFFERWQTCQGIAPSGPSVGCSLSDKSGQRRISAREGLSAFDPFRKSQLVGKLLPPTPTDYLGLIEDIWAMHCSFAWRLYA